MKFILILYLFGKAAAVVPLPYSSVEACQSAAKQAISTYEGSDYTRSGMSFTCVPAE